MLVNIFITLDTIILQILIGKVDSGYERYARTVLLNVCFERASGSVGFGTELDEATQVWGPCPNHLLFTSIIYIALYEYCSLILLIKSPRRSLTYRDGQIKEKKD